MEHQIRGKHSFRGTERRAAPSLSQILEDRLLSLLDGLRVAQLP